MSDMSSLIPTKAAQDAAEKLGLGHLLDRVGTMFVGDDSLIRLDGFAIRDDELVILVTDYDEKCQPIKKAEIRGRRFASYRLVPMPAQINESNVADLFAVIARDPMALIPNATDGGESAETAVDTASNAEHVRRLARIYEERAVIATGMQKYVAFRMSGVASTISALRTRTKYLSQVLGIMESYAGIYEQIVQIADGEPASADTPVHIYQAIRYMDEEVGSVEANRHGQRGIDFSNVEDFDAWIVKPENLGLIMTEDRFIVGFIPTRQRRYYSDNPLVQAARQRENRMLYLFIRNGDRLYRIYSGNITGGDRIIPTLSEWEEMIKTLESESETSRMRAAKERMSWTQIVMMLQGLFHRTDVFSPTPHDDIDLFQERDYANGHIVLHRDYEAVALQSGAETYAEWKKRINAKAGRGTRIYISELIRDYADPQDRNTRYKQKGLCQYPQPGVYEVQRVEPPRKGRSGEEKLVIYFMPSITVWSWEDGYKDREQRDGFRIYRDDTFWINYDELNSDDIAYHVENRAERQKYLETLPLLQTLLWEIRGEEREEAEFIHHICTIESLDKEAVVEAVEWWKKKNIWKRPLRRDIDKAWRMIRHRAKGDRQ